MVWQHRSKPEQMLHVLCTRRCLTSRAGKEMSDIISVGQYILLINSRRMSFPVPWRILQPHPLSLQGRLGTVVECDRRSEGDSRHAVNILSAAMVMFSLTG
jgi:hypothetical protein